MRVLLRKVFVGIETPSLESLSECNKIRSQRGDLVEAIMQPEDPDDQSAAARLTTEMPGLTAQDVERARSMADEGGASAVIADAVDVETAP